ncbi:glycosyltransferase family 4 protein [Mesobacillus thioparans]|uniref:glycosyltransferase family 4 protein n=1 Tax=Mesobacillus thioparans TaxID=370439 RepID=UPI0039EE83D8
MAKVLILANNDIGLYKFRKELIEGLVKEHEVFLSLPNGDYVSKLVELGSKYINTPISRRSTNPITDLLLLYRYNSILKRIKPDVVLTYTIKPNIYGGMMCRLNNIPYITNVTGLGTAIENPGLLQKVTLNLYRLGLKNARTVFFQNKPNLQFFIFNNIVKKKVKVIPGSGVNLKQHNFENYPEEDKVIRFLFIGRIMKAKGIEELFESAKRIKKEYKNVQFDLIGGSEENYAQQLNELSDLGIINYHGHQHDVHSYIKKSHATILPSYHEGTSNVLLESASSGRPVLASNVPGCIETFDDGISGIGFEAKSVESLFDAIKEFIILPYEKKKLMGIAGRRKMEKEFNRKLVVDIYMDEINKIIEEK